MPTRTITIDARLRRALLDHARRERPRECCGLLLGRGRRIGWMVAMENLARGTTRFRIDPAAHIQLRRTIRQVVPPIEIRGVYHSHPSGTAWPSPSDVREAYYPDWVHLIVGLGGPGPRVKAFRVGDGRVTPLAIEWASL